jgi:putative Mg2+ transporter-C (MgtC) family protein
VVGFERGLRGSSAGDRTFSLIGAGAAALTAAVGLRSPQAIAGAIAGIGFLGAGVVIQGESGTVHGITTAASVFAVACLGVVAGSGRLALAALTTAVVLVVLELPYIPGLRLLDSRRYERGTMSDSDPPMGMPDGDGR